MAMMSVTSRHRVVAICLAVCLASCLCIPAWAQNSDASPAAAPEVPAAASAEVATSPVVATPAPTAAPPVQTVTPMATPLAADPLTEKRLVAIAKELRCLVCQNETIADSSADLAVDLRAQIRTMIAANQSDAQIMQYMTDRYGDFVRYRPAVVPLTYALWFGPAFLLLIASFVLWRHIKIRRQAAPLTPTTDAASDHQAPLQTTKGQADTTTDNGSILSATQRAQLDQLLRSPDHD